MSTVLEPTKTTDPLEEIPTLPEEPDSRRDILLKAADLIDKHGWRQGGLGNEKNGFCIIGAVATAGHLWGYGGRELYDRANKIIGHTYPDGWNDGLRYDQKDRVITALRRLADGASWSQATR